MYAILFHAHQKINRTSRRHLRKLLPADAFFPGSRSIMHFEGRMGPDAAKLKKQHGDQPWHFLNPFNEADDEIDGLIDDH